MAESNSQPVICPCGFFGSAQTLGLCSKCYRESGELREQRNVFVNSDLRSHNNYNNPNNNSTNAFNNNNNDKFNSINRNIDEDDDDDDDEEEDEDEYEDYEEHLSNVELASPSSSPVVLSPSPSSAIVSSIPSFTDNSHAIIQKTVNTSKNKSEKTDDIIPTPKNFSTSSQNLFQYPTNNNILNTTDNKNTLKTNNTPTNNSTPINDNTPMNDSIPINDNTPTNDKTLTNNIPTSKTTTQNNIAKAPNLDYTPELQKLKQSSFPRPQSDSMISRNVKRRYADAFSGCGNLPSCSSASVLATPLKIRKKCSVCNVKLDLALQAIGKCKCELSFCSQHRLPEQHQCTYDHKEWSRNEARTKMVVFKKHVGTALKRLDNDC